MLNCVLCVKLSTFCCVSLCQCLLCIVKFFVAFFIALCKLFVLLHCCTMYKCYTGILVKSLRSKCIVYVLYIA